MIKISFPPSKCNTNISYNISWPLLILYANLLSTKTSKVISHFSPKRLLFMLLHFSGVNYLLILFNYLPGSIKLVKGSIRNHSLQYVESSNFFINSN